MKIYFLLCLLFASEAAIAMQQESQQQATYYGTQLQPQQAHEINTLLPQATQNNIVKRECLGITSTYVKDKKVLDIHCRNQACLRCNPLGCAVLAYMCIAFCAIGMGFGIGVGYGFNYRK